MLNDSKYAKRLMQRDKCEKTENYIEDKQLKQKVHAETKHYSHVHT